MNNNKIRFEIQAKYIICLLLIGCIYAKPLFSQKMVAAEILGLETNLIFNSETELLFEMDIVPTIFSVRKAKDSGLKLDSLYETINYGYEKEYVHWYCNYSGNNMLDNIRGDYFNELGEDMLKTVLKKYNSSGNLIKWVISQPDYPNLYLNKDSTKYEVRVDEYEYKNDKLTVYKYKGFNNGVEEYFYDEQGKLIKRINTSVFFEIQKVSESTYLYNNNGMLEYIVTRYLSEDNKQKIDVKNYSYESTDSSSTVTISEGQLSENAEYYISKVYSFKEWSSVVSYIKIYDEAGNVVSYSADFKKTSRENNVNYKFEYSYTNDNLLTHVDLRYPESVKTLQWETKMQIDYNYDDFGNILQYRKTSYDKRLDKWVINNTKEYFYSKIEKGLTVSGSSISNIGIQLYPNPTKDLLYCGEANNSNYIIFNMAGKIVEKGKMESGSIDVSNIVCGCYLICIDSDEGKNISRFIKQ